VGRAACSQAVALELFSLHGAVATAGSIGQCRQFRGWRSNAPRPANTVGCKKSVTNRTGTAQGQCRTHGPSEVRTRQSSSLRAFTGMVLRSFGAGWRRSVALCVCMPETEHHPGSRTGLAPAASRSLTCDQAPGFHRLAALPAKTATRNTKTRSITAKLPLWTVVSLWPPARSDCPK
jgi:hypothetical protein